MAYSKQTWVRGEKVASTKLNHMEDGIATISANGAIDTANLAPAAVTNDKLDQEAVDSNNIRTGAIITPLIYDGAVTTPKLADDAVTTSKLADESVTIDKLAIDTVALLDNKANIDGSYESMTVGNAEQLVSTVGVSDNAPYTFRTTGGSADVGDRMNLKAIVGGTVAWNQLVQTNSASVTVPNAHKYLSRINGTNTIAISNGSAISINDGTKDNVFDLTAMFGSTIADYIYYLEQANAGAGVAYFRKLFPKPYYAYNSGELLSVQTNLHKMTGFNQWDEEYANGYYTDSGEWQPSDNLSSKHPIPVIAGATYYCHNGSGAATYFTFWNAYVEAGVTSRDHIVGSRISTANTYFTVPQGARYMHFNCGGAYGTTYKHDICINLHWDGERDGEYEPYEEHTYALDDVELRGIPKLDASNNLYYDGDEYEADGTVTRKYGTRAYTSGDATDGSTMITDGTTTVYKLTTPTTESADPYIELQICEDFGTEEFVDAAVEANERDVAIPVGNVTFYPQNLRKKIEGLPFDFSTLIARTEKAFKATKAYAVNEFLIINNQLYKTRTSIANGATITVGTNVITTTIGAELSAILNS